MKGSACSVVLLALAAFLSPQPLLRAQVTFTTIPLPSGGTLVDTSGVWVSGNNVAGSYDDSGGIQQGFFDNGTFATIPVPSGSTNTMASAIDGANVAGNYTDSGGVQHGYLCNGTFATIPVPNGSTSTAVTGVSGNNVVGYYFDSGGVVRGFLYNGTFATIPSPNGSISTGASAVSGNNVVGYYFDSSGAQHVFFYNGTFTTIPLPSGSSEALNLAVSGNNVVGTYMDSTDAQHGFIYNGTFTTMAAPTGGSSVAALAVSGNNVVGAYIDGNGIQQGFIYNGTFTTIPSPTGSTFTTAKAVSGNNVTGTYIDGNGVQQGFIYNGTFATIPSPTGSTSTTATAIDGSNVAGFYTDSGGVEHPFLASLATIHLVMHRAQVEALTNTTASAGIDDPLIPITTTSTLAGEPTVANGLVADGVTPLILEFDATDGSTTPTNYTLSINEIDGGTLTTSQLTSQLQVLSQASWGQGTTVALSSVQPGFAYISALASDAFTFTSGATEMTVHLSIQKSDGTGPQILLPTFRIRKPPVVLLHGDNEDQTTWSSNFLSGLEVNTPTDFVQPITYASIGVNTSGPLAELAADLDSTLSSQIENRATGSSFPGWAFTRYDLVCHSQGGVLARMLCTINPALPNAQTTPFAGLTTFRSPENFYRGRFHRIVTIGSPHNGSRFLHYLLDLEQADSNLLNALPYTFANLIQPKFDPFGDQITGINNPNFAVDAGARFHLISTSIAGDQVPSAQANPPSYLSLGLCATLPGQSYTRGQIVVGGEGGSGLFANPDVAHGGGSDGIVDLVSQQGGLNNATILTNYTDHSVAHVDITSTSAADPTLAPFFGVPTLTSQTSDAGVAAQVASLLNGPGTAFGAFTLPLLLTTTDQTAIDAVVPHSFVLNVVAPTGGTGPALAATKAGASPVQGSGTTTYSYVLMPPGNEPLQGAVSWSAEVYAPGGVTSSGVTLSVNATDSTQVTVTVSNFVVGEVALKAGYTSTTGDLIFAQPVDVVSIASSATQTGIALSPSPATIIAGDSAALELDKIYNDGTSQPAFLTPTAPAQFSSSDTTKLTITGTGTMQAIAPGIVTVTATYGGFTAQATVTVCASGLGPQIGSSDTATGQVGRNFSYQMTATNNPTSFGATGLPTGLTMNTTTGLISGMPSVAGTFAVTITAANATLYQDSNTLTLTISPLTSFTQWEAQAGFFTAQQLGNPAISGPTATPQGDGIPNLLKYLYNINPARSMSAADRAALPVFVATPAGELTLTYREYASETGITIHMQTSSDLQTWATPASYTIQQVGADAITGDPIMEVDVKPTGTVKQFLRLNVTSP